MTRALDGLRKASRLRSLCRRLPHLPTHRESRRLLEYGEFRDGRRDSISVEALRAGLVAAARSGRWDEVDAAARRAGEAARSADFDVRTLAEVAHRRAASRPPLT